MQRGKKRGFRWARVFPATENLVFFAVLRPIDFNFIDEPTENLGFSPHELTRPLILAHNDSMTLVGVISDTHGRLDRQAYEALADCDRIIHAGDICGPGILRELETLAPVTAVLGNNDFDEYGCSVGRFARPVIDGVKLLVAHYPRDVRISAFGSAAVAPGDPIPDICIHGHTHIPRLEYGKEARPAQFVLCPGSASYPRGGSQRAVAKIEIGSERVKSIRIESLTGRILMSAGM